MSRLFSWFRGKSNSLLTITVPQSLIESLIARKQTNEFISYLQRKDHRTICIDGFFQLLTTMPDIFYMANLFELITQKSGLTSKQMSLIIVNKLSLAIRAKNFDLCERILRLPYKSMAISLPTYELHCLFHTCPTKTQLIECLSILIEKNLPYDSNYLSWVLVILFEHYEIGDEIIIEHLLTMKQYINLLYKCYGNNNITPLMLFLHLYSNEKCQVLIDQYLSNISDSSILLQCDKWNRSYLTHLLCGQCQHGNIENSSEILSDDIAEVNKQFLNQCPHASAVLSRFSMLYKLGNKFDTPMKIVFSSQFCFPLRMVLINYLIENGLASELKFEELFLRFPPQSLTIYSKYLKRLVHNHNLNSALESLLVDRFNGNRTNDSIIKFLLQQGARIDNMDKLDASITNMLLYERSMIPFMLLDYSFYINIPSEIMLRNTQRVNLYICRVIQCGYPSKYRTNFDDFKSRLTEQARQSIEAFIDVKTPQCLSKLCLQKIRGSMKNLGDETTDKLKDYLPNSLRRSIVFFGYDECLTYFQSVAQNG